MRMDVGAFNVTADGAIRIMDARSRSRQPP